MTAWHRRCDVKIYHSCAKRRTDGYGPFPAKLQEPERIREAIDFAAE